MQASPPTVAANTAPDDIHIDSHADSLHMLSNNRELHLDRSGLTCMQRCFRARLPNGMMVRVTPYSSDGGHPKSDLAEAAAHLADLLDSLESTESTLLSFLESTIPAVFEEADPIKRSKLAGPSESGADLVFDIKGDSGVGIVEIKSSCTNSERGLRLSFEHIRDYIERLAPGKHVNVAYLIAGRRRKLQSSIRQKMESQYNRVGTVPVVLLSWDDIVDRLSVGESEDDEASFEVVLVEVIRLSRRLLRTILSKPAVLGGIDDRKFEELIATLLFDMGMQDVQLTPPRQDGGRDIVIEYLSPTTNQRQKYLVECKHWVSGNKITMRWAVSLLAVARREEATGAILLSSSGFGPRLLEQETTLAQNGLFLKDQGDLLSWANGWQRQYGSVLIEPVDPKIALDLNAV